MKVICDDIANIYIDGVEKVVPGTGAWNQLSKFYVPATTTTIGIQCRNTGFNFVNLSRFIVFPGIDSFLIVLSFVLN